jgi:hypothetical protein
MAFSSHMMANKRRRRDPRMHNLSEVPTSVALDKVSHARQPALLPMCLQLVTVLHRTAPAHFPRSVRSGKLRIPLGSLSSKSDIVQPGRTDLMRTVFLALKVPVTVLRAWMVKS